MTKRLPALLLLLGFLCSGCTYAAPETSPYAPPVEKRLVIYTSHKEEVYGPIVQEFQLRTGIWAEVVTGGTNDLLERIYAESDQPVCDVMFGGGVESLSAYGSCLQPYLCKSHGFLKNTGRSAEHLWTPFSSLPIVLIYNTRLVAAGELKGWADLMGPRWKGQIALADPMVSGSGYTGVRTLLACLPGDPEENLIRFVENLDGKTLPDSGEIVEGVRSGSFLVGITLEETALKGRAAGADITIVYPQEGTSAIPDGTALIAGAPHRENAEAFLDFVLEKDVQELVASALSRRSVRFDIPEPEHLPMESQLGMIDYNVYLTGEDKAAFLLQWQSLMGDRE